MENIILFAVALCIFLLINKLFNIVYLGMFAIVSVFVGCVIASVFVLEIIAPFLKYIPIAFIALFYLNKRTN